MRKCNPRRLLRHRLSNFGYAMANADDCRLPGGVQQRAPVGGINPAAFTANGDWKCFAEIAREQRRASRHLQRADCNRVTQRTWSVLRCCDFRDARSADCHCLIVNLWSAPSAALV